MVRFGDHISSRAIPEWKEKHIDYNGLKSLLLKRKDESGDVREKEFFKRCGEQLKVSNEFYTEKARECARKCEQLESQANPSVRTIEKLRKTAATKIGWIGRIRATYRRVIKFVRRPFGSKAPIAEADYEAQLPSGRVQQLKDASEEFYFELECLKQFKDDNVTGFRKIVKKHDKLWKNTRGVDWYAENVLMSEMAIDKQLTKLCERVEHVRIRLERGDRKKAMKYLRLPTSGGAEDKLVMFSCGFWIGIFVAASMLAIIVCNHDDTWKRPDWILVRFYRGHFLMCWHLSLCALATYIWKRNLINYALIFELDPRKHLTTRSFCAMVSVLWALLALSVFAYVVAPSVGVSRLWSPLIVTIVYVFLLINPLPIMCRSSRYWLLQHLWISFTAACPGQFSSFVDFFLINQFASLTAAISDWFFIVCMYATEVEYDGGQMYFKMNVSSNASIAGITDYVPTFPSGMSRTGSTFCSTDDYGIRPIFMLLPATIRTIQNLRRYYDTGVKHPHLWNAIKYTTYHPRDIFNALYKWHGERKYKKLRATTPFIHMYFVAATVCVTYTLAWDCIVDWKVLETGRPGYYGIRQKRLYSWWWTYYLIGVADALIRLRWAPQMTLRILQLPYAHNEVVSSILAPIECFRRFIWNVFRVENEQLHNVDHLRVTRRTFAVPSKGLEDFGKMLKNPPKLSKTLHVQPLCLGIAPPEVWSAYIDDEAADETKLSDETMKEIEEAKKKSTLQAIEKMVKNPPK